MRIFCLLALLLLCNALKSQDYYGDRLFLKIKYAFKDEYDFLKDRRLATILPSKYIKSFQPVSQHPLLNYTYELILNEDYGIDSLLIKLSQIKQIDYAEKVPLYKVFFTPNDPMYSTQWNLSKIQADLAWNLGQGCTNVKIAVTDDGFLMNHEDLVNQWSINSGEINGNGIDDDGNGYIDDWRGWDAANNDNDPSATAPTNSFFTHGTHVAGIVAAQTHNNLGIASIGYNCKMIPVKIGSSPSSSLTGAFQGLDYAINASGCDVVNMSWGGGGWSATYQTLFNIAKTKGIICVAAAGNSNTSTPMYPASYNHVISVAASANNDARASFSNYGSTIDVTAPGVGIPSCLAGATNAYGNMSGTSMASPLVAGLCGLMKCYNPMPSDSIEACLKRTCDNINAQNPSFIGQLGAGRINAFQALQCLTKKPKSDFLALDTFQCIGKSVRYVVKSFGVPTLTYAWSFPGGTPSISTLANPVVTYATNGLKSATLITCNSLGCDTMTKTNYVNIDTPKAWLTNRKYASYNSNPVIITVHFKGNPPYNVTLTDGTNNFTQTNIRSNPYFFSIVPMKDTSLISISSFSDSLCVGNKYGMDTIYKNSFGGGGDTTICITITTNDVCAYDGDVSDYVSNLWEFNRSYIIVGNWTIGGSPYKWESILKFDLRNIPSNATINSANLSLFADKSAVGWGITGKPTYSSTPNNSVVIRRVTGGFSKSNPQNYPVNTATVNQVLIPPSTSDTQSYPNINIKNIVQDIVNSNINDGISIKPQLGNVYNSFVMASGNNSNPALHPKLVVCFTIPKSDIIYKDCDTCDLNTGLVLNLPFNGNTNDISGNNNHATNFGATPVAGKDGVANTAYKFDGVNDYMKVLNSSTLGLNSAFSVTCKIKIDGFNSDPCRGNMMFFKGHSVNVAGNQHFDWFYAPNAYTGSCSAPLDTLHQNLFSGTLTMPSPVAYSPYLQRFKWYCFVAVQKNDTIYNYIDGIMVYKASNTGTGSNPYDIFIGKSDYASYPYWLNATIDDIRVYNRSLAPSEVKGYCGTCNVPPSQITCNNWLKTTNPNDRLTIGDLDITGDKLTLEALVNQIDTGSNPTWDDREIISKHSHGYNINYHLRSTFGSVTTDSSLNGKGVGGADFYYTPSICKPMLNKTYHVAVVYDGSMLKFYRNGYLMSQVTAKGNLVTNNLVANISNYAGITTGGNNHSAKGYVDEVRIWNVARTQSQIQSFMNTSLPNPTTQTGLLGYYTFDNLLNKQGNAAYNGTLGGSALINQTNPNCSLVMDSCGIIVQPPPPCDTTGLVLCMSMDGNANDSTKYAHHGIVRGATLTANRFGNTNSAYSFNGINQYLNLGVKPLLKPNNTTISMWVKPNTPSTSGYGYAFNPIMVTGNTNTPGHMCEAYFLGVSSSGNNKFHASSWNPATSNVGGGPSIQSFTIGSWYHLTTIFDNDSVKIFINGILDKSYFKGFATNYSSVDSIIIAYSGNNTNNQRWFNGAIDELKMYNRVLSASEISNLYTKPFTCSCNPIQPPPCDTAQRYTYTQCLNDSIQVNLRLGSQYQWSPVSGLSKDTIRNPKIFVSNTQRYLVSYTSSKNCQLIDTIDIEVKAAAIYSKMDDQLICIGDSVQMTIPIYATNIVWSPNTAISSTNSKNPFFFPTIPTTYYLEFRDTFGCLQRDTFLVNTKICCPARARFSIPKDLLCFGETLPITNMSKGSITSYNWNFGTAIPNAFAGANPPSISFSLGRSYTLRLIVTNGSCFDTMIKTVNVVHIIPNAGKDTTNCLGAFITQLGESAISDWSYNWTPTKYLSDPTISDPICSIVNDSVNYVLEIIDRKSGCKAFDTVIVYTNRAIDSTVQNLRICGGDSVLFNGIQRKTSGNYYFTLKKADGICDSFISVLRLNVLQNQRIKWTDTSVCEAFYDTKGKKHTISFTQYDTIRSRSILNCDSLIYFRSVKIYNKFYRQRNVSGCEPFRYNGKTYTESKMKVDSIRIRNIDFFGNCDTIEYINVIVYPKPKAEITPSIPNPVMYKQTVTLTASGGSTYLWLQTSSRDPEIEYKIQNTIPKLFTVRVADDNQCWDTVSYVINGILPDTCYYGFPNAFTPNGDGLNDEYMPNMDECTEVKVFAIYDRWGEKVFETNQLKGWDGVFKGKPAMMGVYIYYAELNTPWGIRKLNGSFTLIR